MSEALLQGQGLACERDERVLFTELDLAVPAGAIVRLVGPNGAGKTTLLRGIAGLSSRVRGQLFWRGEPLALARQRFLSEVLFLGHDPGVKLALSGRENLEWCTALWAAPRPAGEQIAAALDEVGLAAYHDTPCQYLSAGQRRRVALARLLLSRASLWILDEPFTAIDTDGVSAIEGLIARHAEAGGAVLMTTHHGLAIDAPVETVSLERRH